MSDIRRGFVLHMWTGLFPINRSGQPRLFKSARMAAKYLARYPSWGHEAVTIYEATVRPGANGKPDYFLEKIVAEFPHELDLARTR